MIKFIWDIVKQLPLPILFGAGSGAGLFLLWVMAHTIGVYLMGALLFIVVLLFVVSVCLSSKKKPVQPRGDGYWLNPDGTKRRVLHTQTTDDE